MAVQEAAVRILSCDGPDRFSASALAREAGVSQATMFHHFRTIDEIPVVAIEQFWLQSISSDPAKTPSARA